MAYRDGSLPEDHEGVRMEYRFRIGEILNRPDIDQYLSETIKKGLCTCNTYESSESSQQACIYYEGIKCPIHGNLDSIRNSSHDEDIPYWEERMKEYYGV